MLISKCPECGSHDITSHRDAGCGYWFIVLVLCMLPLFFYPFLDKVFVCKKCGTKWKA